MLPLHPISSRMPTVASIARKGFPTSCSGGATPVRGSRRDVGLFGFARGGLQGSYLRQGNKRARVISLSFYYYPVELTVISRGVEEFCPNHFTLLLPMTGNIWLRRACNARPGQHLNLAVRGQLAPPREGRRPTMFGGVWGRRVHHVQLRRHPVRAAFGVVTIAQCTNL